MILDSFCFLQLKLAHISLNQTGINSVRITGRERGRIGCRMDGAAKLIASQLSAFSAIGSTSSSLLAPASQCLCVNQQMIMTQIMCGRERRKAIHVFVLANVADGRTACWCGRRRGRHAGAERAERAEIPVFWSCSPTLEPAALSACRPSAEVMSASLLFLS